MTYDTADAEADAELVGEAFELVGIPDVWRSNILYGGVELGVFEAVGGDPKSAATIADELETNKRYTHRLLRALAYYGVVDEGEDCRYTLTPLGELFQADHPLSVGHIIRFLRSEEQRAVWQQLPDIVEEGGPTGWEREFGVRMFDYLEQQPELAEAFNGWMTVFSHLQVPDVVATLDGYDFSSFSHICDVGGSHGYLLCLLLQANPHLEGSVLELEKVVEEEDRHWAPKLGVADRCTYVAGDMFESVPEANGYFMKSVLHNWADDECVDILEIIHENAPRDGRVFVVEPLMPPRGKIHASPSKVRGRLQVAPPAVDVSLMISTGGRERTLLEFKDLMIEAGWSYVETWDSEESKFSIVEAKKQ